MHHSTYTTYQLYSWLCIPAAMETVFCLPQPFDHTPCSKTHDLIEILEKIADDVVKSTGFFHSGPERYCNKLHPHPE